MFLPTDCLSTEENRTFRSINVTFFFLNCNTFQYKSEYVQPQLKEAHGMCSASNRFLIVCFFVIVTLWLSNLIGNISLQLQANKKKKKNNRFCKKYSMKMRQKWSKKKRNQGSSKIEINKWRKSKRVQKQMQL